MSKQRQRGTRTENEHMERWLRRVWPDVERAPLKGTNDRGDFVNVGPVLVESKYRSTTKGWRVAEWARTAMRKAGDNQWMVIMSADKRKKDGFPIDLVVMPAEKYFEELE